MHRCHEGSNPQSIYSAGSLECGPQSQAMNLPDCDPGGMRHSPRSSPSAWTNPLGVVYLRRLHSSTLAFDDILKLSSILSPMRQLVLQLLASQRDTLVVGVIEKSLVTFQIAQGCDQHNLHHAASIPSTTALKELNAFCLALNTFLPFIEFVSISGVVEFW